MTHLTAGECCGAFRGKPYVEIYSCCRGECPCHSPKTGAEGWREEFDRTFPKYSGYAVFDSNNDRKLITEFISRHIESAYEQGVKASNFKCALRVIKALEEGEAEGAERGQREERRENIAQLKTIALLPGIRLALHDFITSKDL